MRLLAKYLRAIPIDVRAYFRPFLYGFFGGLAAVGFQAGIKVLEWVLWTQLSHIATGYFVLASLATILVTSLLAGLLIAFVSRDAAGSGIPQLKIAFWRDFGFLPIKVALVKFFAGIITIGGGCSFGREGPTVHIAGALASNIAGILGVAKQGRRPALLSGAAAGLAAAFNTPLSAIIFVMEEIVEDLNNTRFLAQTLVASVAATFVAHLFLGEDPAFVIPPVQHFSWVLSLLVTPTAALAALAGVAFQKGTLIWRDRIKRIQCSSNFYSEVIERDGVELDRHIPPRSLATLHNRPISTLANFSPVFADSIDSVQVDKLCAEYPYGQFPLVIDGRLVGVLDRKTLLDGHAPEQAVKHAETVYASATIREAIAKMVDKSASLLVVLSTDETPIGIVTLHDVVRLQSQVTDAM